MFDLQLFSGFFFVLLCVFVIWGADLLNSSKMGNDKDIEDILSDSISSESDSSTNDECYSDSDINLIWQKCRSIFRRFELSFVIYSDEDSYQEGSKKIQNKNQKTKPKKNEF